MEKRISTTVLALLILALVGLIGCTASRGGTPSSSGSGHAAVAATAGGVEVAIQKDAFKPRSITVGVGDTVTWTNTDSTAHTVSGTGFTSGRLAPDQSYSHRFETAGTYEYGDALHTDMVGIVTVQ